MGVRNKEEYGFSIVNIVIFICIESVLWKKTRQPKGITKMVWRKGRQPRNGGFAMEMSVTKLKIFETMTFLSSVCFHVFLLVIKVGKS